MESQVKHGDVEITGILSNGLVGIDVETRSDEQRRITRIVQSVERPEGTRVGLELVYLHVCRTIGDGRGIRHEYQEIPVGIAEHRERAGSPSVRRLRSAGLTRHAAGFGNGARG